MAITIISGDPGKGKTSLATALGVGEMTGINAINAVNDCDYLIKKLTTSGFPLLQTPTDHLVYSDYTIHANDYGNILAKSKEIEGFRVGLYCGEDWETAFLPPRATIILDEAQMYYDSKRAVQLPDFVTKFYAMHRHNYYNIILVSQRPISIDKSIRGLCEQFICITDMTNHYDSCGNVCATTWDCVEFNNTYSAESYSDSKVIDCNGKPTQYRYIGNIFDCYDSHGKFALYYNNREKQSFVNTQSKFINWNGEEIRTYNSSHTIETPKIFLKQKPKKEEDCNGRKNITA